MSCSQIAVECTKERFSLVYPHPNVFYHCRYIFFSRGNAFAIYRYFLSWCLDASQWALLGTAVCYIILACNAVCISRRNGESNNESKYYKSIKLNCEGDPIY
ncbi:unnamed protein product [Schistosoma mattheei]|uniref:Uncharacterized protein n=1 Tax=Schistosoma mattheei TaxID=31246 RepID=A0AA85BY15_9TREM|nr:unnamed protein product [Schistosoma mattheei]